MTILGVVALELLACISEGDCGEKRKLLPGVVEIVVIIMDDSAAEGEEEEEEEEIARPFVGVGPFCCCWTRFKIWWNASLVRRTPA